MANKREQPLVTKKHLARKERERIQQRYILIGVIVVLTLVVILIGYGVIEQVIVQPNQPIAVVNGEILRTSDYQARVKYQRYQLVQQYYNILQTMQLFGGDESSQSFFLNNLQQIEAQLADPSIVGQQVLDTMIEDTLIRQEAARREIAISQEEVQKSIQEAFGYYENGAPTPETQPTPIPNSTLSPTQLAIVTVTPTPTASPTLTPTLETTPVTTGTPTEVADPTPQPTATPYTFEAFQTNFQEALDRLNSDINFKESQLVVIFESLLFGEKIQEAISTDLQPQEEQVWARHILVEDEEAAQEVIRRLGAGEDWSNLAAELSTDPGSKDQGGDLGWFPRGRMVAEFEEVAFNLEIGEISEPVQSSFGWHIIQALGHELKPLTDAQFNQLKQQALQDWLSQQRGLAQIEIKDYWADRTPDEPAIPPGASSSLIFPNPTATP